MALFQDLQRKQNSIEDFYTLTIQILSYLPAVLTGFEEKASYRLYISEQAGLKKTVRPINTSLFIDSPTEFQQAFSKVLGILEKIKSRNVITSNEETLIDSVFYTIQQSIGAGLDLLVNPNAARKHVGNRFEELIQQLFTLIGVSSKKVVLQIPYETDEGQKIYKCENDLVISPYPKVKSTHNSLDKREIVVSIKTTSKDRMGKMFIDKMLLERFVKHEQKVIGVFLNDVQRKEGDNISYTLVSGLFMVYTQFLTELNGVYYLDPPPNVFKSPFSNHMSPFSKLISKDIWELLAS